MDFLFKWKDGALELQAHGLGETVALFGIAAGALVALALILRSR